MEFRSSQVGSAKSEALRRCGLFGPASEPIFDDLTMLAARLFEARTAFLALADGEGAWLKSRFGVNAETVSRAGSFCGHVMLQSGACSVEDASRDERFSRDAFISGELHACFCAGAPIISPEGLVLGALCVMDPSPRTPFPGQLESLEALSRQSVALLELRLAQIEDKTALVAPEDTAALQAGVLEAKEEVLRLLLENSSDGVNVCEMRFEGDHTVRRLIFCNDRFVEMSGRTREELMACPDLNLLTGTDQSIEENNGYLADIRAGRSCRGIASWSRPDGRVNQHEWVAVPLRVGPKLYVMGIDRDTTDRQRALAALEKERNEALMIFNSAPVSIWYKDTHNHILRLNAAARSMGRRIGEVEGRESVELHSPEDDAAYYADDLEVIRTGQPKLGIIETLSTSSGEVRCIQTDKVPYRDENGQIIGVIVFAQDITEIKRAEEERLHIERRLQQARKLESLGALAGGVAHDFNNLLTSVLGKVGLARAALSSASPVQRHLEGIEASSHRAAELCRQMLAYSGHHRFNFQPLDMGAFLAECLPLLRLSLNRQQHVDVECDCGPDESGPLTVRADPAQLRQILLSLLLNAAEACEGIANGLIRLSMGTTQNMGREWDEHGVTPGEPLQGESVYVEVADNGCGMVPNVRSRIFDPFFTTKFTGRGLGLAAALGIVRGHHGALQVRSEPGGGSTFRLLLPRVIEQAAAKSPASAAPQLVLVVDGEETIRAVTANMLDALGFKTLQAKGGAEALALYSEAAGAIAAVVLDLAMSDMEVATAFERLRQLDPKVKVIFMSSFHGRTAVSPLGGKHQTVFLQKPFTLDHLREKLHALLFPGGGGLRP
jgi:PAS domain S-box-containing protein